MGDILDTPKIKARVVILDFEDLIFRSCDSLQIFNGWYGYSKELRIVD
jgi:hypothetical protein|tara:strand:+ start:480 stop:623 length:144 start_codon:yes stop_codon:yes gene_type:complete